jgi:serine/threonine protein kinase
VLVQEYKIRALIGEGTLGTVYATEHPRLGRKAALKVLHHARLLDRAQATRFIVDARTAQSLRHPHLADVIEVGILPGGQAYVMTELLRGETLGERLRRVGTLPVADVLDFGAQAASALDAAHQRGLVHGRLTREDIFLVPDLSLPRGERVKLLDLGTAPLEASDRAGDIPSGSAVYRAPETTLDPRADIYALAGLLYHALCGTPPFSAGGQAALVQAHREDVPASARSLNRDVPAHLSAALRKALARRPEDRFSTMTRFIDALSRHGRAGPRLDRFRAASALMVLAFSGTLLWSGRSPAGWSLRPLQQALLSVPRFNARPARRPARAIRPPVIVALPANVGPPLSGKGTVIRVEAHQQKRRARTGALWDRRH